MENLKINTEKLCGFYVSDWHLVTMILPYINKELNEKANIITVLEKDIEENIKTLTAKLNLKNEKQILGLNWKGKQNIEDMQLEKQLGKNLNIIFVNGSKEYIDFTNRKIEEVFHKNKENIQVEKIKIINCYEVTEFNHSIKEILDNHDKILNTSGEKYVYEVFEGYSPVKKIC